MVCFEEIISGEIIINQNEKVGEHKKTGLGILQQSGV